MATPEEGGPSADLKPFVLYSSEWPAEEVRGFAAALLEGISGPDHEDCIYCEEMGLFLEALEGDSAEDLERAGKIRMPPADMVINWALHAGYELKQMVGIALPFTGEDGSQMAHSEYAFALVKKARERGESG